jgi:primosomal protein N''
VKAMAAMLPDIQKHFAAVSKAELPMVLRDKQAAWVAGVDDLKQTIAAYKGAVEAGDNDALLKAAEKLHTQYEALVKIVRPVLKEMEDFHATLYVLYHYQINPLQPEKAAESIRVLKVKMETLSSATLPERLKAKTEAFNTQRARLAKSIDDLIAVLDSNDASKIKTAIEIMHTQYENLERVF